MKNIKRGIFFERIRSALQRKLSVIKTQLLWLLVHSLVIQTAAFFSNDNTRQKWSTTIRCNCDSIFKWIIFIITVTVTITIIIIILAILSNFRNSKNEIKHWKKTTQRLNLHTTGKEKKKGAIVILWKGKY